MHSIAKLPVPEGSAAPGAFSLQQGRRKCLKLSATGLTLLFRKKCVTRLPRGPSLYLPGAAMYEFQTSALAEATRLTPESAARAMLVKHWDGRLPVDPMTIAASEGLTLQKISPFDKSAIECSGRFDANERLIEYSITEAPVRQRFTVAHELGHYALNHGSAFRDDASSFSSGNRDPKERQANQFAAELLMPKDALVRIVQSGKFAHVEELASIFNVSKVAMSYRVGNLGLLR